MFKERALRLPVRHFRSCVFDSEVKPLSVSVGVHIRPQIEFVIVLSDFHNSGEISRLKPRFEDKVIGIKCIRLCREKIFRTTDA